MKRLVLTLLLLAGAACAAPSVLPNGAIISNGLAVVGSFTLNGTNVAVTPSTVLTNGGAKINGQAVSNGTDITVSGVDTNALAVADYASNRAEVANGYIDAQQFRTAGNSSVYQWEITATLATGHLYFANTVQGNFPWLTIDVDHDDAFAGGRIFWKSVGERTVTLRQESDSSAAGTNLTINGHRIITLGNDGAGSGVDADYIRGQVPLLPSDLAAEVTNYIRFLTTAAAPSSNTAAGSLGECRLGATNLFIYSPSGRWFRATGTYNW